MQAQDLLRVIAKPALWGRRLLIWSTIGFSVLRGDRFPSYYVLGHPKTGTNWVCRMLSLYTGKPVYEFWKSNLPTLSPAIIHMHRFLPFASARHRTIYVMRDGRDIVISYYYQITRRLDENPEVRAALEVYLGKGFDPEAVVQNLPGYIRYLKEQPISAMTYADHIALGFRHPYIRIRYEDLLENAVKTMAGAIDALIPGPVDMDALEQAVKARSFANVTGRESGAEDRDSFIRKGVAGDWRNYFTREVAEAFLPYGGSALIAAGYESSDDWASACPESIATPPA